MPGESDQGYQRRKETSTQTKIKTNEILWKILNICWQDIAFMLPTPLTFVHTITIGINFC